MVYLGARLVAGIISAWFASRIVSDMRMELHTALQRLQLRYFAKRSAGEMVGRIMHDTQELRQFLVEGLPYLMVNCVSFLVIAVILVKLDHILALFVFLPVPALVFGANLFWRRLDPLFHRDGSKIAALHSLLHESIDGIKTVKAFVQEKTRAGKFNEQSRQWFKIRFHITSTWTGFQEVMFWIMQLGVSGVWFVAAWRITRNDPSITLGTLLAFVGYIWLLYGPMQWFTAVLDWMTHAFAGAERIFSILDTPPEIEDAPNAISVPGIKGSVSFASVHFSYEKGKEVIKGMNFDIKPGEMVGLVGKSGAGKSTVINLVCRFYDVDSGAVLIDGHNIRDIKLAQLRHQIGIVMQEPFLFRGSIMDNIRYGVPGKSFDDVMQAAKAAHAHDFILNKEDGYDTVIGDNGIQLSGGEKQRISIARAIILNPPILILDEATSSVDSETEKYIQDAIANLIRERTTIAIAHRLATLRNADRLFILDDGAIVEKGTHDQLMESGGHYARLVKMQSELNKIKGEMWKE
jgi:ATP-binding cassette subfamily B protein